MSWDLYEKYFFVQLAEVGFLNWILKPMLFVLFGVAYLFLRRAVENVLPVTSEVYAEWLCNLAHYFEFWILIIFNSLKD